MKKTFKGFTLVECIVALAILAIACLILGGIEASVARTNTYNHFTNSSLSNQMAYIERYENADTVKIENNYSGTTPPSGSNTGTTAYVKITKIKQMSPSDNPAEFDPLSTSFKPVNRVSNSSYSFPVDIYVMYSRDTNNKGSNEADYGDIAANYSGKGAAEKEGNLRYKYILGH